jgi:hypothetical protein
MIDETARHVGHLDLLRDALTDAPRSTGPTSEDPAHNVDAEQ